MGKLDVAARARGQSNRKLRRGFLGDIQDFLDSRDRNQRLAQFGQHPADFADRPDEHLRVGDERDHRADGHGAFGGPPCADEYDRGELGEAHEVGCGPVDGQDFEEMPMAVAIVGVLLRESFDLEILAGKGADDADAGQVFLKGGGHDALGLVGFLERSLNSAEKEDGESDDHRHEGGCAQGHLPVDAEKNREIRSRFASMCARSR